MLRINQLRVRVRLTLKNQIMSNHKRLSIEEFRTFPGFENYTDEMAKETIKTLESLSILFYELHQKSIIEKDRLNAIFDLERKVKTHEKF